VRPGHSSRGHESSLMRDCLFRENEQIYICDSQTANQQVCIIPYQLLMYLAYIILYSLLKNLNISFEKLKEYCGRMRQSRWLLLVAVVLLSVTKTLGSIPSTCIQGVCYSCPAYCSIIKTESVGTPEATCTCEGNGPDTLCSGTPCTTVEKGSVNVDVDSLTISNSVSSRGVLLQGVAMVLGGMLLVY